MIGLNNVTERLGATRVVPGSHKWEEPLEEAIEAGSRELGTHIPGSSQPPL